MKDRTLILTVDGGGTASQVSVWGVGDARARGEEEARARSDAGVSAHDGASDAGDARDDSSCGGRCVREAEVGPLSVKAAGEAVVAESLTCLAQAIADLEPEVSGAVLGLSGLDDEHDVSMMGRLLFEAGLAAEAKPQTAPYGYAVHAPSGFPLLLVSDAILPLFANGHRVGTVLIAGTGSVAVHVDERAQITRIGGWGYRTSDEGSGCWLGCEFVRAALHAAEEVVAGGEGARDGAREGTSAGSSEGANNIDVNADVSRETPLILRDALAAIEGATPEDDAFACAHRLFAWSLRHESPRDFSALARFALESTAPEALALRDRAAHALARIALLAHAASAESPLVIAGSLFKNEAFEAVFRAALAEEAGAPIPVEHARASATAGALALARQVALGTSLV